MQAGSVSVMMPAYNAERYIGQAINSLLVQEHSHWELIVVDDGSTDDTGEILAHQSDPRIRAFSQSNQGEAAARNVALQQMQGEFLAFLDADDVYLPNHLATTVQYLQTHPDYDGVYTDGYHIDEDGTRLSPLSSRRRGPFSGRVFEEVARSSDVFGPPVCVVLRADVIKEHRLQFDPDIIIGPDWDFFLRFADLAQFGYIDEKTCLYRIHQSNITARIDLQRRAHELAKCRMNAIKMENFKECSSETQAAVFYDLLVNQLRSSPKRQEEITHWPEFQELPTGQQARLLRLMASRAVISGISRQYVNQWLRRSRTLDPTDRRGALLATVYRYSPLLCRFLLRLRTFGQADQLTVPPFADLDLGHSS